MNAMTVPKIKTNNHNANNDRNPKPYHRQISTNKKQPSPPQPQQPPAPPPHLIKSLACKNILCALRPLASSCLDKLPPPSSSNAAKHAAALRKRQTSHYCSGRSAIDSQNKHKSKHIIPWKNGSQLFTDAAALRRDDPSVS